MTCPYCSSTNVQVQGALVKEEIMGIQDGRPITRKLEVYRCGECGRTFDEGELDQEAEEK